jgi:hypothetical protein
MARGFENPTSSNSYSAYNSLRHHSTVLIALSKFVIYT